ncbi:MAG: Uma2 family endonuclease [Polyangiaceae bacterium]
MSQAAREPATVADLLALPESGRAFELIDGVIEPRGAACGRHGAAQCRLGCILEPFDRRPSGHAPGGFWLALAVDISFDPQNTLRPDLVGWRRDRVSQRPKDRVVSVRPDWVCEILSTNRRTDLIAKKRIYHRHEVPHYWIIDPDEETLTVNRWTREGYLEVLVGERGDAVRAEPFEAIEIRIDTLFGDDDEENEGG